jgi:DNA/RNA-binding domain of Phe-tRNA-synthetase-like protein
MQRITISSAFKQKAPEVVLSAIECHVVFQPIHEELWQLVEKKAAERAGELKREDISRIPAIHHSRNVYKKCGKDPARYRPSAEALLRRIVRGDGLCQVNNVVDQLNLVSLTSGFSIGGYDADKIQGPVELGIGRAEEPYEGIGRRKLNIENMPVFRDSLGAFGTPTRDSERTSVQPETKRFLMILVGCGAHEHLKEATGMAVRLLTDFAGASHIEIQSIT